MGVMVVMAAFRVGPMSEAPAHAPGWIIGIAGVLFASCGILLLAPARRVVGFTGGIVVIGISVISAWVALFGDAQYFTGGMSVFARTMEVFVARVLFGAVAVLGFAIAANALRRILTKPDADKPLNPTRPAGG